MKLNELTGNVRHFYADGYLALQVEYYEGVYYVRGRPIGIKNWRIAKVEDLNSLGRITSELKSKN